MATNQGFKSLVPREDRVHSGFLYWWLRSNRPYLEGLGNGATFKEVSKAVVSRIEIPLPPLCEQRRIADILDRADALRAKRRASLAQLDTLAQSIFLEHFSQPDLPETTIGKLLASGDLLLHKDGNHGSLYPRPDDFDGTGIPFITAAAITDDGQIDDALIPNLKRDKAAKLRIGWISNGDVLLAHNASVGKVALYDGRFEEALIGTSLTAFRPNPKSLASRYLEAALRSERFQRQLKQNMSQTTRNQVPITAQRGLRIPKPTLCLQTEFAAKADAVERLKTAHRTSLVELDELFASLQHRAFRGEL